MKQFWIYFLAIIVFTAGYSAIYFYAILKPVEWYHILLFLGSLIITIPALNWWRDYFKRIFDSK